MIQRKRRGNGRRYIEDVPSHFVIPERDQQVQVHRFLWRNLETSREPDVYVKTVLTFCDKQAPAMAQTALRKTAQES